MKIILNELKKIINLEKIDKKIIEDAFNNLGYEVENIEPLQKAINVKIGKTISCVPHPNADNLSYCKVLTDKKKYDVVCGGKNVNSDQWIFHAIPGSIVGNIVLEEKKLRGIISQGMILSISEILGIDNSLIEDTEEDNIYIIKDKNVIKKFDTDIFDLSILPDRQYATNYYILAKELATYLDVKLLDIEKELKNKLILDKNSKFIFSTKINISKETKLSIDQKIILYKNDIKPTNNFDLDILKYLNIITGIDFNIKNSTLFIQPQKKDFSYLKEVFLLAIKYLKENNFLKLDNDIVFNNNLVEKNNLININETKIINYIDGNFKNLNLLFKKLENLYFNISNNKILVPLYRDDVLTLQDITEEIIRFYGVEKIKEIKPKFEHVEKKENDIFLLKNKIKSFLIEKGFFETNTYHLLKEQDAKNYDIFNLTKNIKLKNNYSLEFNTLRKSLLKSLIDIHNYNYRKEVNDIRLFEISNIFHSYDIFNSHLALIHDSEIYQQNPILATKQLLLDLFKYIKIPESKLTFKNINQKNMDIFNPYSLAEVFIENNSIGIIGELHPKILRKYKYIRMDKIKEKLYYFEINLTNVLNLIPKTL